MQTGPGWLTGAEWSAASVHRFEREELPPDTLSFLPQTSLGPLLQATLPASDPSQSRHCSMELDSLVCLFLLSPHLCMRQDYGVPLCLQGQALLTCVEKERMLDLGDSG